MEDPGDRMAEIAERKRVLAEEERREGDLSFWKGMSMIGAIGWMVGLPTVGGAFLGWYIEQQFHVRYGLGITLMLAGLAGGCYSVWRSMRNPT